MRMRLSPEQAFQLHTWIAAGHSYGTLQKLMCEQFGFAIVPSAVSWHRRHYAAVIAELQAKRPRCVACHQHLREVKQNGHIPIH